MTNIAINLLHWINKTSSKSNLLISGFLFIMFILINDSRNSFNPMPILCIKSFFDSAPLVSPYNSAVDEPERISCFLKCNPEYESFILSVRFNKETVNSINLSSSSSPLYFETPFIYT